LRRLWSPITCYRDQLYAHQPAARLASHPQRRQRRAKAGRVALPFVLGPPQESRHPTDDQKAPL